MASRTSVAMNTKKARVLAMKEAMFIQMTGIMSEYQWGIVKPPIDRQRDMARARKKYVDDKNKAVIAEFRRLGLEV